MHISNEAQAHYDTTVGYDLEVRLKVVLYRKLTMYWCSDNVTRCHTALNLKVGKMKYGLGNPAPDWTKLPKVGKTSLELGKKKYSLHKSKDSVTEESEDNGRSQLMDNDFDIIDCSYD